MNNSETKIIAQIASTVVMAAIAITLLKELSVQSQLIKSLSFLFFVAVIIAVIAIVLKIKNQFR